MKPKSKPLDSVISFFVFFFLGLLFMSVAMTSLGLTAAAAFHN